MSKMAQMANEAVVDYSSRVSSILLQIQNCNEIEVPDHTQQYNVSAEANAVKAFLTGMKPEIFSRLRNCEFDTLDDAISAAIKGEAEYKENMMRTKITEGYTQAVQCSNCFGYGHSTNTCSSRSFQRQQVSSIQWQPKYCQHCQRPGHTIQNCWFNNNNNNFNSNYNNYNNYNQPRNQWMQPNRVPQNQTPVNQPQNMGRNPSYQRQGTGQPPAFQHPANQPLANPTNQTPGNQPPNNWYQGTANWRRQQPPICAYCQNIGHTIEQCRKKAYQEKIKNQPQQQTTTQEPQATSK
ncbi:myb-like protein AA [Osmia bicornis bicornis]|uniref:myb-like protein AA n=1 Tax=Osmia bicornis bicornis TaxID=1437191 RepID=UPI001EAF81D7|nr:myb-like protein AA [Osmia bicornis bicornis]